VLEEAVKVNTAGIPVLVLDIVGDNLVTDYLAEELDYFQVDNCRFVVGSSNSCCSFCAVHPLKLSIARVPVSQGAHPQNSPSPGHPKGVPTFHISFTIEREIDIIFRGNSA